MVSVNTCLSLEEIEDLDGRKVGTCTFDRPEEETTSGYVSESGGFVPLFQVT